jgi:hypothetical protein
MEFYKHFNKTKQNPAYPPSPTPPIMVLGFLAVTLWLGSQGGDYRKAPGVRRITQLLTSNQGPTGL